MHVEAWGLNHSLYLPYVMHGRPSVAASFSLRPQDSLWDGAHHARLTGDVVGEILGGKVDRADWSVAPDDHRTGARPRHKLSLPYPAFSSCPFAQVDEDDATRISYALRAPAFSRCATHRPGICVSPQKLVGVNPTPH